MSSRPPAHSTGSREREHCQRNRESEEIQDGQAVAKTGAGMQNLVEDGLTSKCVWDGRQ